MDRNMFGLQDASGTAEDTSRSSPRTRLWIFAVLLAAFGLAALKMTLIIITLILHTQQGSIHKSDHINDAGRGVLPMRFPQLR
jgi:hypothetical protein